MKIKALLALSADPVHLGHLDIMRRSAEHFDLTVLVANNPAKKYMFTLNERCDMVKYCLAVNGISAKIESLVDPDRLTVDYAFEYNIPVIVRGVRNFADYDYEKMIRDVNMSQQSGIETFFLSGDPKMSHISSGAVKELFNHAGLVHDYVPIYVKRQMEKKAGLQIIGVTGNIASGKSWFCENLTQLPNIYNLDVDRLAHYILFQSELPSHQEVRRKIRNTFNLFETLYRDDKGLPMDEHDRSQLGNIVFSDAGAREKLNAIMYQPLLTAIRRSIVGKKGIVLVNAALLAEFKLMHLCNNQVVLITIDEVTRTERLKQRGMSETQIKNRLASQYTDERKRHYIEQAIERDGFGELVIFPNISNTNDPASLYARSISGLAIQ